MNTLSICLRVVDVYAEEIAAVIALSVMGWSLPAGVSFRVPLANVPEDKRQPDALLWVTIGTLAPAEKQLERSDSN